MIIVVRYTEKDIMNKNKNNNKNNLNLLLSGARDDETFSEFVFRNNITTFEALNRLEIVDTENQIDALQAQIYNLSIKVDNNFGVFNDYVTTANARFTLIDGKIILQQEEIDSLSNDVNLVKDDISSINETLTTLSTQVDMLNSKVLNLNNELIDLTTVVDNNILHIDELDAEVTILNSNVASLDTQVSSLSSSVSVINVKIDDIESEISNIEQAPIIFKVGDNVFVGAWTIYNVSTTGGTATTQVIEGNEQITLTSAKAGKLTTTYEFSEIDSSTHSLNNVTLQLGLPFYNIPGTLVYGAEYFVLQSEDNEAVLSVKLLKKVNVFEDE